MKYSNFLPILIFILCFGSFSYANIALTKEEQAIFNQCNEIIRLEVKLSYSRYKAEGSTSEERYKKRKAHREYCRKVLKKARRSCAKLVKLYKTNPNPQIAYAIAYHYTYNSDENSALKYANQVVVANKDIVDKDTIESAYLIIKWANTVIEEKKHLDEMKRNSTTIKKIKGGSVVSQGLSGFTSPPRYEKLK